ncbi:MAG: hypothetical protein ACKV22_14760 [Bryobacteraceae bacterium]
MALFMDSPVIGLEDLAAQDTGILEVAAGEGIDLERKILIARDEIGIEIESALVRSGLTTQGNGSLSKIVVTPALRLYWVFHAIAVTYRDAYCSRLHDRYKGRWSEYRDLAKWAARMLFELGAGWVAEPVPQPPPPLVTVTTGSVASGLYYVRVSWVNSAGQESLASLVTTYTVGSDEGITVESSGYPSNVTGWNVYAGTEPDSLSRQNGSPLPTGADWIAPNVISTSGPKPGEGQQPETYTQIQATFQRG